MGVLRTDSKKVKEFLIDFADNSSDQSALKKFYMKLQLACVDIYCEQAYFPREAISRISFGFAIQKGVRIENIFRKKRRYLVDIYGVRADLYRGNRPRKAGRIPYCQFLFHAPSVLDKEEKWKEKESLSRSNRAWKFVLHEALRPGFFSPRIPTTRGG
jgi:hypothetical protein